MVGTGFFQPRVSESPGQDMATLDRSQPKPALHVKQAVKDASAARQKGNTSSQTGTTNDTGRRLPKLTANCGNRPFTTQGFSSPWSANPGSLPFKPQPGGLAPMPPAIHPQLPNEQMPAMVQYVSVPGMTEPSKMRRCSWEEAGLSNGGACSSNSSSCGVTIASVGLVAPQVSGGVPASSNPAFAAGGVCAAPGAVSTQFGGASSSQFGPQVLIQPMMQGVPYQAQAAVVPQYGVNFAPPPAAAVVPTALQCLYTNHSAVMQQQQQHLATPGRAAAPGAVLQLQPQQLAGNGAGLAILGPVCKPSALQGPSMSGQLYTAGGNASGTVLGSSVLGAPGTTAPCASATQAQLLPTVHSMVAVPAQNVTLVAGGPQVQYSAPAAAPSIAALQGMAVLPEATGMHPGSSNTRLGPAGIAPSGPNVYAAPTGYAAPAATARGVDVSSVAAAVAQDKLAQMQQLEAMQQQLRRDVYTLLPYIEPPHVGMQQ